MNKGLEALKKIEDEFGVDPAYYGLNIEFEIVREHLKALEIIKKHLSFTYGGDYENIRMKSLSLKIESRDTGSVTYINCKSKEEFELLMEVLDNGAD